MALDDKQSLRNENDYYKLLGVVQTADLKTIKKAFRQRALIWHPDRNIDNQEEAELIFKKINKVCTHLEVSCLLIFLSKNVC